MRVRLYILGTELFDLSTGPDAADSLDAAPEPLEMTGGPVSPDMVPSIPQDPLTGFYQAPYAND